MSSRNANLEQGQRAAALSLSQGLALARELYGAGERDSETLAAAVRKHICSFPEATVDYVSLIDSRDLEPVTRADEHTRLALAAYIGGKVRLIDNGLLASSQQEGTL